MSLRIIFLPADSRPDPRGRSLAWLPTGAAPPVVDQLPWRHPPVDPAAPGRDVESVRGWAPILVSHVQPVVENCPWRHPPVDPSAPAREIEPVRGWAPALVAHVQPFVENLTWRHPPPELVKVEGESGNGQTWARFLGSQPTYRETLAWHRTPLAFEDPIREPGNGATVARLLGPNVSPPPPVLTGRIYRLPGADLSLVNLAGSAEQ